MDKSLSRKSEYFILHFSLHLKKEKILFYFFKLMMWSVSFSSNFHLMGPVYSGLIFWQWCGSQGRGGVEPRSFCLLSESAIYYAKLSALSYPYPTLTNSHLCLFVASMYDYIRKIFCYSQRLNMLSSRFANSFNEVKRISFLNKFIIAKLLIIYIFFQFQMWYIPVPNIT